MRITPHVPRRLPAAVLFFLLALMAIETRAVVLDYGVDPAHLGKGDWIYIVSSATAQLGGNVSSVHDVASWMAYEKSVGMNYLIVKAGESNVYYPNNGAPQFTAALVASAHNAGLKIFGYTRSYGQDVPGEVNIITNILNLGADGYVIDAEAEWELQNLPRNTTKAVQMCSAIKAVFPTRFLAHSPLPIISSHSSFPYIQFGTYCDAVMPQDYWQDGGLGALVNYSPSNMVAQMDTEWHNWQNSLTGVNRAAIKPIVPIGQGWNPTSTNIVTADQIIQFNNALNTDANPAGTNGYFGVNYFRAELHTSAIWTGISQITYPPFFSAAPGDLVVMVGQSAVFSATASGTPQPAYQWQLNATNIAGATGSAYSIASAQPANSGTYQIIISNSVGSLTNSAALSVIGPPVITNQPASQVSDQGGNVTFNVLAGGLAPLAYQWQFNSMAIAGATNTSFALANVQGTNAGSYSVVITNQNGSATSANAVLTVAGDFIYATILPPKLVVPVYGPEPADATIVKTGNDASALPAGTQSYTGVKLAGAGYTAQLWAALGTNQPESALALVPNTTVSFKSSGGYINPVSPNPVIPGAVEGQIATLEMRAWDNRSGTVANWAGVLADPTVNRGVSPLFNSLPLGGVSAAPNLTGLMSFNLHLPQIAPAITNGPFGVGVKRGANATFAVSATGTQPLAYQWLFNGNPLAGGTTNSYTVVNAQAANVGNYYVFVTNGGGSVTSSFAGLSLIPSQAPQFQPAGFLPNQAFQMTLSGDAGSTFYIEQSSDLVSWNPLTNLVNSNGTVQFIDPSASHDGQRFYRAHLGP